MGTRETGHERRYTETVDTRDGYAKDGRQEAVDSDGRRDTVNGMADGRVGPTELDSESVGAATGPSGSSLAWVQTTGNHQ